MRCDELMTPQINIIWSQSATELHYMGPHTILVQMASHFPGYAPSFVFFPLQETCSGSNRGEATISKSLHIASAAKCKGLKGR